ncbi:MAG: hypothetical protein ACE5I1_07320 [bacterium]
MQKSVRLLKIRKLCREKKFMAAPKLAKKIMTLCLQRYNIRQVIYGTREERKDH